MGRVSAASSSTLPPDVTHAAVEADEAVAQGRLPAAGLAGEARDLAVRDLEGDAVEGVDIARHA